MPRQAFTFIRCANAVCAHTVCLPALRQQKFTFLKFHLRKTPPLHYNPQQI